MPEQEERTNLYWAWDRVDRALLDHPEFADAIEEAIKDNDQWSRVQLLHDWAEISDLPTDVFLLIEFIWNDFCWIPARNQVIDKIMIKLKGVE